MPVCPGHHDHRRPRQVHTTTVTSNHECCEQMEGADQKQPIGLTVEMENKSIDFPNETKDLVKGIIGIDLLAIYGR